MLQDAPAQPALTKVCREIRQESLPLFYSSNIFVLNIFILKSYFYAKTCKGWESWLRAIGPVNRRPMSELYVQHGQYCDTEGVLDMLEKFGDELTMSIPNRHARPFLAGMGLKLKFSGNASD
jgi:hypothetical protein